MYISKLKLNMSIRYVVFIKYKLHIDRKLSDKEPQIYITNVVSVDLSKNTLKRS